MAFFVYPIFIIILETNFDKIGSAVILFMTMLSMMAILRGSDKVLMFTVRALQTAVMVACCLKVMLFWQELLVCPAQSPGDNLAHTVHQKSFLAGDSVEEVLNCTIGSDSTFQNENHAVLRAMVSSYFVFVVVPMLFRVHAIEVQFFIGPMFFMGGIDIIIACTYVPSFSNLITALFSPMFAGMFICIISLRSDFLSLKSWQEMNQKEAWLASVAHNFGAPLMTISYSASQMWETTAIEDTDRRIEASRLMLKRQRVAVDYLRCIYSTVMYQQNGKHPVSKRQRFKIKTLQQACEDVTSTYGSSMFPDIAIVYFVQDSVLPEFIVGDWAKIQQCVVNLVSNAQKHCKQSGEDSDSHSDSDSEIARTAGDVTVLFSMDTSVNRLRIEVCDSGNGVNNTLVQGYFEQNGTGLGSVRMMMESMGGDYGGCRNAESGVTVGIGSTFYISVPLDDDVELEVVHHDDDHATLNASVEQRGEEGRKDIELVLEDGLLVAEKRKTAMSKKYKLLLVDDVSLNREIIRVWLLQEFTDLVIVDASNGKEALDELQKASFDIVLMDISMPVMDGFACLEEMTILYGKNRPPTIAISAGVMGQPKSGTGAKFDQWWDKTDQSFLVSGMKALMLEIAKS